MQVYGVQPSTTAINVTLLAFAADRRVAMRRAAAAALQLGARRCRSISPTRGEPSSKRPHAAAAVDRWDRQTDGRTPYRFIDHAPHVMRAMPLSHRNTSCAQVGLPRCTYRGILLIMLFDGRWSGITAENVEKSQHTDFNEDKTNASVPCSNVRLWKLDTQTEWRNTYWRLWDERTEKDSAGFVDSEENKWEGP